MLVDDVHVSKLDIPMVGMSSGDDQEADDDRCYGGYQSTDC